MLVLLNKQESTALKKKWTTAGKTYRVRKQDHRVFEVRRGALRGLVGKRKGTLVKRHDFPRGLRAFPRGGEPMTNELAPHDWRDDRVAAHKEVMKIPLAKVSDYTFPVASVIGEYARPLLPRALFKDGTPVPNPKKNGWGF